MFEASFIREKKKMGDESVTIDSGDKIINKNGMIHILKEIVGFVLFMHQQIPSPLQELEMEFASLKLELENMETEKRKIETASNRSFQRKLITKQREIKMGIKKFEKLMTSVSNFLLSMETMIQECPEIYAVLLVLGGSSTRPQSVYEILFHITEAASEMAEDNCSTRKIARPAVLAKKILRKLISRSAGCSGPSEPTKLFLLIKAPSNISVSREFLPKRDFRYNKKVHPFRLIITSSNDSEVADNSDHVTSTSASMETDIKDSDVSLNDSIWFQCKHIVKGLPSQNQ